MSPFDYQGESNLIRLRMDRAAGTYPVMVIGSVKVNVEPLPASLSTQSFPHAARQTSWPRLIPVRSPLPCAHSQTLPGELFEHLRLVFRSDPDAGVTD